jgi:uncharacterized protein
MRSFAAPREAVWEALTDPAHVVDLLPGLQSFEVEDEEHWTATIAPPLALGGRTMNFVFELDRRRPPEHARLTVHGKGSGTRIDLQTEFDLSEDHDGTRMAWRLDVELSGLVGRWAGRVLQPIARQYAEAMLARVERRIPVRG